MNISTLLSIVYALAGLIGTLYWSNHADGLEYYLPIFSGGLLMLGVYILTITVLDTCHKKQGENPDNNNSPPIKDIGQDKKSP